MTNIYVVFFGRISWFAAIGRGVHAADGVNLLQCDLHWQDGHRSHSQGLPKQN